MHSLIRSLLVAALVAVCGQASAQAWPAKPVKLIVSQAAGGAPTATWIP